LGYEFLTGILLAAFTGCVWGSAGIFLSHAARHDFDIVAYSLLQYFLCLVISILLLPQWGALQGNGLWLIPLMIGGGILNAFGQFTSHYAMRYGKNGPLWAIVQSSLVIPFLASLLFFHQKTSVWGVIGVLFLVSGILLPVVAGWKKFSGKDNIYWLLTAVSFLCFGSAQTLFLLPSCFPVVFADPAFLRPGLLNGGNFAGWGIACTAEKHRLKFSRNTVIAGISMAVFCTVAQFTLFLALDKLSRCGFGSAAVPFIVGTSIVCFSIYIRVVAKEKNTLAEKIALILLLGGIACLGFRM